MRSYFRIAGSTSGMRALYHYAFKITASAESFLSFEKLGFEGAQFVQEIVESA